MVKEAVAHAGSNWKTSIAGASLLALGYIGHYMGRPPAEVAEVVATGIGFLLASDSVISRASKIKQEEE